ncbi:uncharacterized protein EDB91DRAFT_1341130 [Suillus paluster]|uniref:uncharacterized protein n=1 Tax=Suillus paluster TaxID=48578 RepID=UPI001B87FB5F|nr:uncharacterized protein EDB91DRAFT_1341130 [Suillus paluster]KAG1718873.1 hypothetical protein EDB91DRAFT_1341130 [Suillus paluster]
MEEKAKSCLLFELEIPDFENSPRRVKSTRFGASLVVDPSHTRLRLSNLSPENSGSYVSATDITSDVAGSATMRHHPLQPSGTPEFGIVAKMVQGNDVSIYLLQHLITELVIQPLLRLPLVHFLPVIVKLFYHGANPNLTQMKQISLSASDAITDIMMEYLYHHGFTGPTVIEFVPWTTTAVSYDPNVWWTNG